MDELKALYNEIENPIDNKIKWSKLLNIYSTSFNYEDFYNKVSKKTKKDTSLLFDNEDKKTFCLVMWSIWKSKILKYSEEELREFIENKKFDYDIYDVVGSVRNLESLKTYGALQHVLTDPAINKYFSLLFDDYNNGVEIYSDFDLKKDLNYNLVLSIKVDAIRLYKILKYFITDCVEREIPYFIRYTEFGKKIVVNFYSTIENFKKNEEVINIIKKENYMYFHSNYELLSGNIDDVIAVKHKNVFNNYQYLRERSLIVFKSFDSVTYEYVINHLNTLVSYKDGRMNIIDYLSTYVMESIINDIIQNTIKTNQDYFYVANSGDLANLKQYIKEKLSISIKEILKERLYLKDDDYVIPFTINSNKMIKIKAEKFMCAIRNLVATLISKDGTLEKAYRIRIKNECQFYEVDYEKFCLDKGFSKKVSYDKKTFEKYQNEIARIHDDIKKVESLENLISSEITEEARSKIYDSMNELNQIFNAEEGN